MGRRRTDEERRAYPARVMLTKGERDRLAKTARDHAMTLSEVIRLGLRSVSTADIVRGDEDPTTERT